MFGRKNVRVSKQASTIQGNNEMKELKYEVVGSVSMHFSYFSTRPRQRPPTSDGYSAVVGLDVL
jgi:hypothetical protein